LTTLKKSEEKNDAAMMMIYIRNSVI